MTIFIFNTCIELNGMFLTFYDDGKMHADGTDIHISYTMDCIECVGTGATR